MTGTGPETRLLLGNFMAQKQGSRGVIMVINHTLAAADNLKELIEFMDEPEVRSSTPDEWRERLGDRRLGAVFIGSDLTEKEVHTVVGDVGSLDANTPIVMLHEGV
jgi:hypothetical protein